MVNHFNKNEAYFTGTMLGDFKFAYQVFGRDYFSETLVVKRLSGVSDYLQIVFSEGMVNSNLVQKGTFVQVKGQIRNYRLESEGKYKTRTVIFVTEIQEIDQPGTLNKVELEGYICKEPIFRVTPAGKKIAETIVAVNKQEQKNYIYVIAWEECAKYVSKLKVGSHIELAGRLQSRNYQKAISKGEIETRTVYEISVYKITDI